MNGGRMWWLGAFLVLGSTLSSVGAAASSSSSSSSILTPHDCRKMPYQYAVQKVITSKGCSGTACTADAEQYVNEYCGSSDGPCPSSSQIDLYLECSSHSRHSWLPWLRWN